MEFGNLWDEANAFLVTLGLCLEATDLSMVEIG